MAELSLPKSLADRTCAESVNDFDHHGSSGTFVSVSGGASCFASGASLIAVQPDARGQEMGKEATQKAPRMHTEEWFPVAGSSKLKLNA